MTCLFQRGRNKELESRCKDFEKRYAEEKVAREESEAKVRALRIRIKEMKENELKANEVSTTAPAAALPTKHVPTSDEGSAGNFNGVAPETIGMSNGKGNLSISDKVK